MANSKNITNKSTMLSLVYALVSLGVCYSFFSLSIDKGNLFYYLLTLISLVYFLKFLGRFLKGTYHVILRQK